MKHKEEPLISIIVPCFNQGTFLEETLDSVLNQVYTNWECIIINDGSTDSTTEIAILWVARDIRYKYIEQENKGVCNARNSGISAARGEFIFPLDADDKISPVYIKLAVDAFLKNPDLKLVYCEAEKFGEENGVWKLPAFSAGHLATENVIFSSALYKKEDWERIGGYDENMVYGLEDWEFWIALLKKEGKVKKLDHLGFFYRINKLSRNRNYNLKQLKSLYDYISIKHSDFFVRELGSFMDLQGLIEKEKADNRKRMKSKKFVVDLFTRTFFGFSVFGKI